MKQKLLHFFFFIMITGLWGSYLFFADWITKELVLLLDLEMLARFASDVAQEEIDVPTIYDWIPLVQHFLAGSFLLLLSWMQAAKLGVKKTESKVVVKKPVFPKATTQPVTKSWNQEIDSLYQLGEYLKAAPNEGEAYARLKDVLSQMFAKESGALCLFDRSQNRIRTVVSFGSFSVVRDTFNPEECLPLQKGKAICREVKASEQVSIYLRSGLSGLLLSVPIMNHGDYVGVFTLLLSEGYTAFGNTPKQGLTNWKKVAGIVAQTVGFYFTNLNFQEKLEIHSIRDPLTGIFNKRYMEETLQREYAFAKRKSLPIGVIMLQTDQFQSIFKKYGERALETVLWEIGSRLPSYIRDEDIPCRFNKKAFAVILPGASREITEARAEKIRQEVKNLSILYKSQFLDISLSVGVASYPDHAEDSSLLIHKAEKALVKALQSGGNQVVVGRELSVAASLSIAG